MKLASLISLAFAVALVGSSCARQQPLTPTAEPTSSATSAPSPTEFVAPSATPAVATATSILTPSNPGPTAADAVFAALLQRVKSSDRTIDFTEFRLAYAKTSNYDPYSFSIGDARSSMVAALNAQNYELALKLANDILASNYIFPDAHAVAMQADQGLGQSQDASFHRHVLNGLIGSILQSGDGKSPKTAFQVVLIEEEYAVLSVLGIEEHSQSLTEANGHSYDVLDGVVTKTNAAVTVYFNVDTPLGALNNSLKP